MKKMKQLSLATALVVICTLMPTTASHKLLHAGELINRENAKIRLGQFIVRHSLVMHVTNTHDRKPHKALDDLVS